MPLFKTGNTRYRTLKGEDFLHLIIQSEKYISLYTDITIIVGLVQQPDKIVVRFALTIYPYSLNIDSQSKVVDPVGRDGSPEFFWRISNNFSFIIAYPVFFQEIVKGWAAGFEQFGGLTDVVAAEGQGPAHSISFGRLTGFFQGGKFLRFLFQG